MNIKKLLISIAAWVGFVSLLTAFQVYLVPHSAQAQATCGGVDTSIIKCDQNNSGSPLENNGVWGLLLIAINILTAGVGVAALGGIVYGAVLYTSAGGNPDQVKKAKGIFVNVAIGVVAFAAMFFFLNFLIPGGIISA